MRTQNFQRTTSICEKWNQRTQNIQLLLVCLTLETIGTFINRNIPLYLPLKLSFIHVTFPHNLRGFILKKPDVCWRINSFVVSMKYSSSLPQTETLVIYMLIPRAERERERESEWVWLLALVNYLINTIKVDFGSFSFHE